MSSCTRGFSWCSGGSPDCRGDHHGITYVRPSLGLGAPYLRDGAQEPLTVGVGLQFNEHDADVAPRVILHLQDGPRELDVQTDFRIDEANSLLLHLETAIMDAAATTLGMIPKHYREIGLPDIKAVVADV